MDRTGALLIHPQRTISSDTVPRMSADLLSHISTVGMWVSFFSFFLVHLEREKHEMKELGYAFTAEITEVVSENSSVLR